MNYGEKGQKYYEENKVLQEVDIRLDAIGLQFYLFKADRCPEIMSTVRASSFWTKCTKPIKR